MRERLTQLIKQAHADYLYRDDDTVDIYGFVADRLIEAGAIMPPVKVGQTVWYLNGGYYRRTGIIAKEKVVTEINIKRQNNKIEWGFIADGTRYRFTSIGKTVFLTHEAAEEALKAREKQ